MRSKSQPRNRTSRHQASELPRVSVYVYVVAPAAPLPQPNSRAFGTLPTRGDYTWFGLTQGGLTVGVRIAHAVAAANSLVLAVAAGRTRREVLGRADLDLVTTVRAAIRAG